MDGLLRSLIKCVRRRIRDDQEVTVEAVTKELGYTRQYVSGRFHRITGRLLSHFLKEKRLGKAARLREGSDVGIISTGLMTERALDAAEALEKDEIQAAVLHLPTLKPLDHEAVCALAGSVEVLLTAENHSVNGGLGTAVADTLLAHRISKPLVKIGIPDRFIECGSTEYLQAKYGLLSEHIVAAARSELGFTASASPR